MARQQTPSTRAKAKPKRTTESVSVKECLCGCGGSPKGRFLPGHDAKLKGRLKKEALGDDAEIATAAVKRLASLGWSWVLAVTPEEKERRQIELIKKRAAAQERKVKLEEHRVQQAAKPKRTTLSGYSLYNTARAHATLDEPLLSAEAINDTYKAEFAKLIAEYGPHNVPTEEINMLTQDSMVRHIRRRESMAG